MEEPPNVEGNNLGPQDEHKTGLGALFDDTVSHAGKRVVQFSTYVAAVTALVGGYHLLVEKLHYESWKALFVASIPLLLTLLTDTFPAWLKRWKETKAIARGVHGRLEVPGYFRLTPYEETDEGRYQRADDAHHKILNWISGASIPILYLTGESGTGKTSLLNAWVLPRLRRSTPAFKTVTVRGFDDPAVALVQRIKRSGIIWSQRAPDEDDPRRLLQKASSHLGSTRLLVVFDQFEEFLILHGDEERADLEQLLESICRESIPGVTILIVLRSDYLPELSQVGLPPLDQDSNWRQIGLFTLRASRSFLKESGLKLSDTLIYEVAKEAEAIEGIQGLIRPITLNMFGVILERFSGQLPQGVEPGALLRGYLEESIDHQDTRSEVRRILREMVTDTGTKRPCSEKELAAATSLEGSLIRGCLLPLANKGIVRQIDVKNGIWEISHDFVARLLNQMMGKWKMPTIQKLLPWIGPGALLSWILLVLVLLPSLAISSSTRAIQDLRIFGLAVRAVGDGYKASAEDYALDNQILNRAAVSLGLVRNLQEIYLTQTQVSDLSPLSGLTNLKTLDLRGTQVSDLSPVSGAITLDIER